VVIDGGTMRARVTTNQEKLVTCAVMAAPAMLAPETGSQPLWAALVL
jgi:hypothetical protein